MIITIHQPEYFPYLGYFHRLIQSDLFVFLDNVQFQRGYINRNRIRTHEGWQWLTVPVKSHHNRLPINKVEINQELNWREQHLRALECNYGRSACFGDYFPEIKKILNQSWKIISDLDLAILNELLNIFKVKIKIVKASDLKAEGKSSELLINICKKLGADAYLSGPGGKNYMDLGLFDQAGIKVKFQDFTHPVYFQQFAGEFQPYLASIDYLFNRGPNLNFKN